MTEPPMNDAIQALLEADARARARIETDHATTLVVEAAAGTGKTTALVGRIVSLVARGLAELRGVVAVTFTEAAAGELKLRLRTALEAARATASEATRPNLHRALVQLEEARIGTIHGFCADLLRERPVEAGVDPLFAVASEDEARALFDRAFDGWFQGALERPPEGLRRTLRRRRRGRNALGPEGTLREAAFSLLDHRDYPTPWRREPWDRAAAIDRLLGLLGEAASVEGRADDREDWLRKSLAPVAAFVREHERRTAGRGADAPRDDDGLEAELVNLARGEKYGRSWTWTGGRREWYAAPPRGEAGSSRATGSGPAAAGLARRDVVALRDRVKAELDRFVEEAGRDLAAVLHAELAPIAQQYERLLQRAGKLDFLDLLLRARALLAEPAVRAELQGRFTHYFVDEFQDTDPLQADILALLAADDPRCDDPLAARPVPGKLFLVGDPKQSIYRFRRADVALYAAVKERLVAAGAEVVYLSKSFRAVPALQSAINAAFALAMNENSAGTQARYVPLAPARADVSTQPALVVLPSPRIYSDFSREPTRYVIEGSFPDAACAFVDWLLRSSGFTVEERGARVPVAARHVCMLFRRMQAFGEDLSRPYVRGLEARQVPHVLVGGRSFHDREEVEAMRQALTAIEWPDDSLAVYATLRGPLFALPDDLLFTWALRPTRAQAANEQGRGVHRAFHLRPSAPLVDELPSGSELRAVAEALDLLGSLHRRRNRRPISDTLSQLLEQTRAHAGFGSWVAGEQALSNVLRTLELARRFETRGGATSFRGFVEWLELAAERGGAAEAPVVEDGTEGVRLLSVHKAKGLEFPVVVLVDPTAPLAPSTPSHWVDHERRVWVERLAGCIPTELQEHSVEVLAREAEESVRLAYVATTRARDLLVVPGVGEGLLPSWLTPLDPVLQPKDRRAARAATGCPPFGTDTVLARPDALAGRTDPIVPGAHVPQEGTHEVTWWDPRVLGLDKEPDLGLRQEAVLHPHEDPTRGERERADHARFVARKAEALARGATVALRTRSVTAMAEATSKEVGFDGSALNGVRLAQVQNKRDRTGEEPGGKRFGTLVHAVLATVPFGLAEPEVASEIAAHCRAHGRLLGATEQEVEVAAARVRAALAHPLLARAAEVEHRREVAVALAEPETECLLEGVVDLCFLDGERWVVVDYKTDRALGEAIAVYATQLQAYGRAIAAATSKPVELVLLSV